METIKLATVCSGIGAPEKALKLLGIPYELVFFSEIDNAAIRSYCSIHGENRAKNLGDLSRIDYERLPKDIDLIVGGTPCQDFSTSGLGKGGEEGSGTRSSLMWYYVKLIAQTKPKIVVWENVAAVLNCKHYMTYRKFYLTLNRLGYRVNAGVLNAKYFNLPQNRVRVFVVAIRKDTDIRFSYPRGYDSGVRIRHELSDNIPDKYFAKSYEDMILYNRRFLSTHNIMPVGRIKNAKFKQTNEVLSIEGIFDCLTTKQGNWIVDDRLPREKPIRHLIPQESLRFMGFEDKDFYKCRYRYEKKEKKKIRRDNVPDGELYMQAGNSIAVNALMALFGQIYGVPWQDKVFKERKKTERELLNELPLFAYMREHSAGGER